MTKNNAAAAIAAEPSERTEATNHANIGEAFLAIMKEVGYVQKLGKNTMQNYKYAGEAQLIEALRPALIKHGVIMYPSRAVEVVDAVVVGSPDKEKKTFRTVINYSFTYLHVASKTSIDVASIGEGVDTGDKSAYKAATGALKYALRQPFLIETGDEPEAHDLKEDKNPKANPPTSGEKTSQQEFGSAVNFKKYYTDTSDAIKRMSNKEQAAILRERITRIEFVDEQCAMNLRDELELRLDELHLQG